jgi:hypothetical protein
VAEDLEMDLDTDIYMDIHTDEDTNTDSDAEIDNLTDFMQKLSVLKALKKKLCVHALMTLKT